MTRVCATAAVQLAPNVISRRKSVPRSFGLVPFPRAHRYTSVTKREVICPRHVRKFEPRAVLVFCAFLHIIAHILMKLITLSIYSRGLKIYLKLMSHSSCSVRMITRVIETFEFI